MRGYPPATGFASRSSLSKRPFLPLTVARIFELASTGFSSTVRLAKSSPDMWVPIFRQNRDNVLDVLDEHINQLARFRSLLIKQDYETFYQLIQESNKIKKILQ